MGDGFRAHECIELGNSTSSDTLFFLILSPLIAVINVIILAVILQAVGSIFRKQIALQAELNLPSEKKVKPDKRYGVRIRAAETGALVSGGGMLALLALLLYLSIQGDITPANTLVIFLGARLQNSVISNGSRSLMRYARSNSRTVDTNDIE